MSLVINDCLYVVMIIIIIGDKESAALLFRAKGSNLAPWLGCIVKDADSQILSQAVSYDS